ncbi:cytochrome b [Sphingomonas aquatilis]|uniref:Cytochrome b561 n=1 Tax=Sphingomonas aquatilis TaxID=93063 RepID=A0AAW3TRF1_9SPHN|nr:cytochrome b [Sphingomonas aquatilis]MBB3875641.1 cytochrome b561 [Sphingomonas aquatilis]MCI4654958.1 cytochrome b [Sphingomonas aquatilis]GEM73484.1 cytochrome b [Sphingomonas aquatilis NBRC 16722]
MTGWARDARYSTVAIAFHWTIAVLIIANLIIGIGHDGIPALRALMGAHKAIGITVLALTLARVAWRIAHRPPPLPAHMPGWEKGLAHATHWSLYLLMLALPLTGWLMVSAPPTEGPARPLTWFGLFDIPRLPASAGAAGFGHEAHELLGWVMVALVVLHVAGALRHHLILRDNVLARMVPMQRR